ncbi:MULTISPECIES: hypothetical protein [Bacteria]|uniref:hypothetical protein n=1 Tax=Bacteria TaxID=2 RepID=UPI003C79AD85
MTISRYRKTEHSDVTYVRGGDLGELLEAVEEFYGRAGDASWRVDGDAIVLSMPMGSELVGRSVDE